MTQVKLNFVNRFPTIEAEEDNMSYLSHAQKEFELAGWKNEEKEPMQEMVMNNVRDLLKVFSEQGHSGLSAPYVLNLFNKLAKFQIITPLTGKDDEWSEASEGIFQNKRDSRVFKDETGNAYFLDGKAFSDNGGKTYYTNKKSRTPITFPCNSDQLKTEYVLVDEPLT